MHPNNVRPNGRQIDLVNKTTTARPKNVKNPKAKAYPCMPSAAENRTNWNQSQELLSHSCTFLV
jgi:hypothetical protein